MELVRRWSGHCVSRGVCFK